MDKLKDGFGLGIGAMLGIGAVAVICVCGVCMACFGLVAIGAANQDSSVIPQSRPTRAAVVLPPAPGQRGGAAPDQTQPAASPAAVDLGQDALAGNIRWKVLEAIDLGNHLQSDNQFVQPIDSQGRFIRVRFEVENRGNDVQVFSDVNLIDSQGRKFKDHNEASIWYVDDKEHCLLEQLNPNLSRTCTMIFEVPLDATGLKFEAGDLNMFDDKEVLINLGL